MKKITSMLSNGLAVYLATLAVVATADDASAAFRTQHSSFCHHFSNSATYLYNGAYLENQSETWMGIYCPVVSDSERGLVDATVLIDVTEDTNGSSSRVCSAEYSGWTYTCGTTANWAAGNSVVYPSESIWNSNTDYGYIYNYVTSGSRIYGYYY